MADILKLITLVGKLKTSLRSWRNISRVRGESRTPREEWGGVKKSRQLRRLAEDHYYKTYWLSIPRSEMAVMSFLLADRKEGTNINRDHCIKLAPVHDMAECIVGDITPFDGS